MKERPAGSYIEDEKGNLTPNLKDKAMKERHQPKKNKTDSGTAGAKEEVDNV